MPNLKKVANRTHLRDAHTLKKRINLASIAVRFTRLHRSGSQLRGLCPFHSERHASFYIHQTKQVFYCFGCGVGGDLFAFVMRAYRCDFRRALDIVTAFSEGVARASESRSDSHLGASEGAKPLSPPQAGARHSRSTNEQRARILAALDATERRLLLIEVTNRAASAALATACEPLRTGA
jgi:hypothetical protein